MLVSLIALTGLAALGGMTVTSVQGGVSTASADRFHSIAQYAAESGAGAAMSYLRANVTSSSRFTSLVTPANQAPKSPQEISGNNRKPGESGNVFSTELGAWYHVEIWNNRADPGYAAGSDEDAKVVIRATGYGPSGAAAIVEWEVQATGMSAMGRPCPGYGQKGLSEDGAGRNDCMGEVSLADTATYRPGDAI